MTSPLQTTFEETLKMKDKPRFEVSSFFNNTFEQHLQVAKASQELLLAPFEHLLDVCFSAIKNGNKILFFGNGGSASDAQHLATELTVRYKDNRAPIAAISLSTDTSALTAIGNDLGFDELFARQIQAIGQPGDIALAISTSGKSPNIIKALEMARALLLVPAALSGKGGGDLVGLADPLVVVPAQITSHIQEMHILLGHMLCEALEKKLGLV